MKIAFVIVSHNSGQYLVQCLNSLLRLKSAHGVAIVVVDNASTDNSIEIAASFSGIHIIPMEVNLGFGAANNLACREVEADYYYFINVDAYINPAFDIDKVVSELDAKKNVAVCGTRLAYPDGSSQTAAFTYSTPGKWLIQIMPGYNFISKRLRNKGLLLSVFGRFGKKADSYRKNHQGYPVNYQVRDAEWVSGASMIVRGEYIKKHGLFDESIFLYGEDEDLCIEAHQNGWGVVLMDTPAVTHVHGWDTNRGKKAADLKFQSLRYFIKKHFGRGPNYFLMRALLPIYVYGFRGLLFRGRK